MANYVLVPLHLKFDPVSVGAGSMELALVVNPAGTATGSAVGTISEGTEHPPTFEAKVSGAIHAAGYGNIVKVGGVSGQALVSVPPPAIGSYLASFSASFGLDASGTGNGTFSVGSHTYECKVSTVS